MLKRFTTLTEKTLKALSLKMIKCVMLSDELKNKPERHILDIVNDIDDIGMQKSQNMESILQLVRKFTS